MKANLFFWVLLPASGILAESCHDKQMYNNNKETIMQILFNPDAPGKYEYSICNKRHIDHKMGEGNLNTDFYDSTGFVLNILKAAEGKFEADVTFSHHDVTSRTNQAAQEIEDESNLFNKALQAFNGLSFAVVYNSHGKISSLKGYDKFKADSDRILQAYSDKELKHIEPSETAFTEDYFKNLLEQPTHLLLGQTIFLDRTWKSADTMLVLGDELPLEIENKVVDYKDGIVYVQTNGSISKELEFMKNETILVKGIQTGTMEIEAKTGILLKKEAKIRLSGSVKIGALEHSITVEDNTLINGIRK